MQILIMRRVALQVEELIDSLRRDHLAAHSCLATVALLLRQPTQLCISSKSLGVDSTRSPCLTLPTEGCVGYNVGMIAEKEEICFCQLWPCFAHYIETTSLRNLTHTLAPTQTFPSEQASVEVERPLYEQIELQLYTRAGVTRCDQLWLGLYRFKSHWEHQGVNIGMSTSENKQLPCVISYILKSILAVHRFSTS